FVLGELFQTRLARKLEHAHRIVVGAVPQIGIEMTEEPAGRRLPGPPKVKGYLPKWFQFRGKRRDYVINLKRRHERQGNGKMAKKKSGPGADNSHHAAGCANELGWPNDL